MLERTWKDYDHRLYWWDNVVNSSAALALESGSPNQTNPILTRVLCSSVVTFLLGEKLFKGQALCPGYSGVFVLSWGMDFQPDCVGCLASAQALTAWLLFTMAPTRAERDHNRVSYND